MGSRKIQQFKGLNVLWRLRAKARTGAKTPGWMLAAVTSTPPHTPLPRPAKLPIIQLPTDKLARHYERKYPEMKLEPSGNVDGYPTSKSFVFATKALEFIKKGKTEKQALALAEEALKQEEAEAFKKLKELTADALKSGATPAIGVITENDSRFEVLQFWKGQLRQSAYEAWPLSKRASLDHWIAREVLKWQPHQTRYLAKEEFEKELAPVREFLFAEEIKHYGEPDILSYDDLKVLEREKALKEYQQWEELMLEKRPVTIPENKLFEMISWSGKSHEYIFSGLMKPEGVLAPEVEEDRKQFEIAVIANLAFPLLRPEFQALPYLSKYLMEAVLEAAKHESRGLKVVWNSLAERFDKVAAETALHDAYPKWVVKTYLTVCVGKPFIWALFGHLLQKGVERAPEGALRNLPELSQLQNKKAMWESIQLKYFGLTEALEALAYDSDNSSLSEDISLAYRRLNELHRIVEELHHANGDALNTIDEEIAEHIKLHHGMIDLDLAVGEVLRKYEEDGLLKDVFMPLPQAMREEEIQKERRESEVLEQARVDSRWSRREKGRRAFEKELHGDQEDEYDQVWLSKGERPTMEEVANPKDLEDYFESVKEYLSVPPVEGEGKQGEVRGYKKRADDKDKDAEKQSGRGRRGRFDKRPPGRQRTGGDKKAGK